MIEAILFDKDGTLFDFQASWGAWARKLIDSLDDDPKIRQAIADEMLFDYQNAQFLPQSPIIAGTSQEIFEAIKRGKPQIDELDIQLVVRASVAGAVMQPVGDLPRLLTELRARGLKLGVATNDSEAGAKKHLDAHNLSVFFDFIAGADSGFGAKPHSGMCVGFLSAHGIDPQKALMVGDSTHDIRSGRDAGMTTVGVLTGVATAADLHSADHILNSIAELPRLLDRLVENT